MSNSTTEQTIDTNLYDWKSPNHKPPFPNTIQYMINADLDKEVMKIAIGCKWCHFCRITEKHNIPYIYHLQESNQIEIWAPLYKAQGVINDINQQ